MKPLPGACDLRDHSSQGRAALGYGNTS